MISPLVLPVDFERSDEFQQCYEIVEKTEKSVYVSGVAGSGKSTFLTFLRQNTRKNLIVLTPTGIAAVNIQGQTIHSLFKFPHALIQKENIKRLWANGLFEKLDLLVIDEISMVRPDLLDGVDYALRLNRERFDTPFGGVQVVMIGDLYQLPPVLEKELAEHYSELYASEFFFSANVLKEMRCYSFMLTKNYRQKDPQFMALLNKIRNNSINEADLRLLNSRVNSELAEVAKEYLRLTPTNAAANAVNHARLAKLPGKEFLYQATVTGEYDWRSHPADEQLRLRVGAQVLMVKNDPDKRWVNGNIGEVVELASNGMKVRIDHGIYDVQPVKWEKNGYRHDGIKGIVPEVIGTFEQFPVRLGWAITIHKSQGLSLDKAIVDLDGGAFAHGQTYVALSRCRSFEGLVLKRPVGFRDIIFDKRIHRVADLFIPINT
ncbi:MAG: AAA family ATPase [Candidatus Omnitrophica bacterium]|nr:AAA family ATPase [Candidatus Omnitrophota bacterium]